MGAKKAPRYRIVAADSRFPRDGRDIETIGWINPTTEPETVFVDADKALEWLRKGAQPSDTVKSLLKKTGISDLFHDLKANRSIEGKAPVAREIKSKQRKLSPKAQARLEAEKAAKAAAEAPAAEEAQA
jgi:small subunit ribosomal protein S16